MNRAFIKTLTCQINLSDTFQHRKVHCDCQYSSSDRPSVLRTIYCVLHVKHQTNSRIHPVKLWKLANILTRTKQKYSFHLIMVQCNDLMNLARTLWDSFVSYPLVSCHVVSSKRNLLINASSDGKQAQQFPEQLCSCKIVFLIGTSIEWLRHASQSGPHGALFGKKVCTVVEVKDPV